MWIGQDALNVGRRTTPSNFRSSSPASSTPESPPTNNQAGRSLRPVVIMRRVNQGTRSDKGLENHSGLRSLFETARRQGKKPHRFFLDLFTKDTAQAQVALYRKPLDANIARPIRC